MKAWIFQAKPERYEIKNLRVDQQVTWLVTRYRNEMHKGDIVFLWRAGKRSERGIYGWGCITDDAPAEIKDWGYGIDLVYRVKFNKFLSTDDLELDGALSENQIMKMPIGTNFRLNQEEIDRLSRLIQKRGEVIPECNTGGA
jgi:hypothetical protein